MSVIYGHQEDSNGNLLLPTTHSVATVELGSSATQSYAKGDLVIWNNRLCQATKAISANDTFAINTNLQYTTMNAQLNNIKVYVNSSGKLVFRDHTGADSVLNFSQIYDLGDGTAFNVSSISGYQNFTTANFVVSYTEHKTIQHVGSIGGYSATAWIEKTYNSSTGVLQCCLRIEGDPGGTVFGKVRAYLITNTSSIRNL